MILLIDNYDSFAYNLYQQAAAIRPDIRVVRNDAVTAGVVEQMQPSHILLSPGPGYPKDAGVCEDVIRRLGGRIPILGVCLGHQAICEVFGARIVHAKRLMHGKQSTVTLDPDDPLMHGKQSTVTLDPDDPLFRGLEGQVTVARYHSLVAEPDTLPDCLVVTARDGNGEIMAVRHKTRPVYGVQFHPESILTPRGDTILKNFLSTH